MSCSDAPPKLDPPSQRGGAVPPEEAEDDAEFGAYEAEARLLALHRAQQRAMLVGDAADASQSMPAFDDGDMYEECEEAEEAEEPGLGYPAVGVASASPAAAPAKESVRTGGSLFPPTSKPGAQPAPQRTPSTVKARGAAVAKTRTGSAKPRLKNGGLPSPRKNTVATGDDGGGAVPAKPRRVHALLLQFLDLVGLLAWQHIRQNDVDAQFRRDAFGRALIVAGQHRHLDTPFAQFRDRHLGRRARRVGNGHKSK